jgi:hypothetical protein
MSETSVEIAGEFRAPRNMFTGAGESIHNDAVASKLGFKGGTVPGSIHMDQFVPLLLDIYGDAWFERGDISTYFTQATVDNERVRATAEQGDERTRLKMFNEAGDLICEGTASLAAPDAGSELLRRMQMQEPAAAGRLRILGEIRVGDENHDLPVKVTKEGLERTLETITENLPVYRDNGVLPPSQVVHLAHMTRLSAMAKQKRAVGLFGALQVQQLRGPLRADVDYLARTKILKLTESPRTENVWYDVTFKEAAGKDAAGGEDVGSMLYCLRFMKGSSPLWAAETPTAPAAS